MTQSAQAPVLDRRRAGVLLHPTSLPSGKLDADALTFLDRLANTGFSVWQMLPLGPGDVRSPYSPYSAFAFNPNLFPLADRNHNKVPGDEIQEDSDAFFWLDDFALFQVIRQQFGNTPWWQWPTPLRQRDPDALAWVRAEHADRLQACKREQLNCEFLWRQFKREATSRGVRLFGDLPIFVTADSVDVWTRPDQFQLDDSGHAVRIAGVPPDDFSTEGQVWDNPVYNWKAMQNDGFDWWLRRLQNEIRRFDLLRLDHFRGLIATWEIPAGSVENPQPQAADGSWQPVPGRALLNAAQQSLGHLPIVAENLGIITSEVEQLRDDFGLPGMHVLQFAFDGNADNPHFPANHETQGVVYTGTHDNDTLAGWWQSLPPEARQAVCQQLRCAEEAVEENMLQTAMDSPSCLAILPMQDLLGLGSAARMNTPGKAAGQWRWQMTKEQLEAGISMHWQNRLRACDRYAA